MSINIFSSYRSSSTAFVREFLDRYIGVHRTEFDLFDWTGPDRILAGQMLDAELRERIEKADIFLAFIDGEYGAGITHAELQHAIATARRRGNWPCIVPLPLDVDGERYLLPLVRPGGALANVSYEPGFNQRGKRYPSIDPQFGDYIESLSREHRGARGGAPAESAPVAPPQAAGVVLLDRADAPDGEARDGEGLDTPEAASAAALAAGLRAAEAPVLAVKAGWETEVDPGIRGFSDTLPGLVYVQVLSAPTSGEYLRNPALLRRRLVPFVEAETLKRSRTAYWLPADQPEVPGYRQRVVENFDADPAFRNDDAAGMSDWLTGLLGLGLPSPVAAYQDVEGEGDMQEMLRAKVDAMVGPALPQRLEDREVYPYCLDALERTIVSLAKRRPVLITHNINANMPLASPSAVRNATIQQLSEVTRCADQALAKQGVSSRDVFWLSILMKGNPLSQGQAHRIPTATAFRLDRWYVLEFGRNGDDFDFETGPRRDKVTEALARWGAQG